MLSDRERPHGLSAPTVPARAYLLRQLSIFNQVRRRPLVVERGRVNFGTEEARHERSGQAMQRSRQPDEEQP